VSRRRGVREEGKRGKKGKKGKKEIGGKNANVSKKGENW